MRVLFAEDDADMGNLAEVSFRQRGVELTWCATLREASDALASSAYDVLVTDLALGDGSGFELAAGARRNHPHMPVILLTGEPSAHDAAPGVFAAILTKPVSFQHLLSTVENVTRT